MGDAGRSKGSASGNTSEYALWKMRVYGLMSEREFDKYYTSDGRRRPCDGDGNPIVPTGAERAAERAAKSAGQLAKEGRARARRVAIHEFKMAWMDLDKRDRMQVADLARPHPHARYAQYLAGATVQERADLEAAQKQEIKDLERAQQMVRDESFAQFYDWLDRQWPHDEGLEG
ncbi:hypothetical protein [Lolliginicoccus suaedae]|uniref:hypothetical protein n=1 Tax=Lolliginicoccus suaedae TaxID=2605429 RepID=UPI0011ECC838|nr:hypothetical protein [Lolliginicoccus suaedae]